MKRSLLCALLAAGLAACGDTRYVPYGAGGADADGDLVSRTVAYELDPAYSVLVPNCVIVAPAEIDNEEDRDHERAVETAVARSLAAKVTRVIGPDERRIAARPLAIDPSKPRDLADLGEAVSCGAVAYVRLSSADRDFLLVWSRVQVGLELRIERLRDGRVLFRGRHVADRSAGGLPLSPLSALAEGFRSSRFAADGEDVMASVIDDAVRRITALLPDAKQYRRRDAPKPYLLPAVDMGVIW